MLKHATLTRPSSRLDHSPVHRLASNRSVSQRTATSSPGLDEIENCDSKRGFLVGEQQTTTTTTTTYNNDLSDSHSFNSSATKPNKSYSLARRQLDFSDKQLSETEITNIDHENDINNQATEDWLVDTSEELTKQISSFEARNALDLNNLLGPNQSPTRTTPSSMSSPPCKQQQPTQSHTKSISPATHLLSPYRCRISPTKMLGFGKSSKSAANMIIDNSLIANDGKKHIESKLGPSHLSQSTLLRSHSSNQRNNKSINNHSMIKVFAQTLSQDVEYKTLQVTSQTRSSQIVRSLLKKFRLKHRDPNLYYLTLERWIRKDGIKSRNVMILSDDACPLQLQQCCSNPPHDDIKFTLQMRAGALVKIYCSDVVQDARYKCLSLSTQTTVEETIDLMVQCLNLQDKLSQSEAHSRITSSPGSIMSTNSSSSGIESDQNQSSLNPPVPYVTAISDSDRFLDNESKASSVTSISTSSNSSTIDQYCLIIECKDTNYRRVLDSDEYLVDVYQGLLAEAKGQPNELAEFPTPMSSPSYRNSRLTASSKSQQHSSNLPNHNFDFVKTNPDQWFLIKLVRRDDFNIRQQYPMSAIRLANPRHSPPPQIPSMPESMLTSAVNMTNVVSTTQIEVINGHFSSHSFSGQTSNANHRQLDNMSRMTNQQNQKPANDDVDGPPSLPPKFIMVPPIKPRRNISMISSSFGPPLVMSTQTTNHATFTTTNINSNLHSLDNRRRYDPARLAEDLSQLDT